MKIKDARESLGYTIREFAELSNVSTSTINRVERGYRVSGRLRKRVLQALNLREEEVTTVAPPVKQGSCIRERTSNDLLSTTAARTGYFVSGTPNYQTFYDLLQAYSFTIVHILPTLTCRYPENRLPIQYHYIDDVGTVIIYMPEQLKGYQTPAHHAVMWIELGASNEKYDFIIQVLSINYVIRWESA
jgi:transcriptional regulator with XRE-family HTH domain